MSRCLLDNDEFKFEVSIGWDVPMNTFYAQVIDKNIVAKDEYDQIIFWSGGVDGKRYLDPAALLDEILPFACPYDRQYIWNELMKDKALNDERIYCGGLVTIKDVAEELFSSSL